MPNGTQIYKNQKEVEMKSKNVFTIFIFMLIVAFMFSISGCNLFKRESVKDDEDYFEEDGFMYLKLSGDNAMMVGVLDETYDKKEIVMPTRTTNNIIFGVGGGKGENYVKYFITGKFKKIFLDSKYYIIENPEAFPQAEKYIFLFTTPEIYEYGFTDLDNYSSTKIRLFDMGSKIIYVPKGYVAVFNDYYGHENRFLPANVTYYYNYEDDTNNDGYYWVDNLEIGDKIFTFPSGDGIPNRNGYKFLGWCTDAECTQTVDITTLVKGEEDIDLFANWEEIEV